MSEVFRILKDSGSMYVFSGWNNLKDILRALDDVGFTNNQSHHLEISVWCSNKKEICHISLSLSLCLQR